MLRTPSWDHPTTPGSTEGGREGYRDGTGVERRDGEGGFAKYLRDRTQAVVADDYL